MPRSYIYTPFDHQLSFSLWVATNRMVQAINRDLAVYAVTMSDWAILSTLYF